MRAVTFRWAADKQLRDAVTDVAGDSRHGALQTLVAHNGKPTPPSTTAPSQPPTRAETEEMSTWIARSPARTNDR